MCILPSTNMISAVSSLAQAAYGFYKTTETIRVQKTQAQESINAAQRNAELLRQKAIVENQSAIDEARLKRQETIRRMSEVKTSIAAGNIDIDSQTSLDKLDSTFLEGELDALNILDKAKNKAETYLSQAREYERKGDLIIKESSRQIRNTLLGKGMQYMNSSSQSLI